MPRASSSVCDEICPVLRAATVLDGKWTLLILRDLLAGTRRFGQLRRALDGLGARTLAERLRALEQQGVVSRSVFAEVPPRVEYALTDKGRALEPVLVAMGAWASRWTMAPASPLG
jgi:DNA-binding HxlR family transcriptional regulator